MKKLDNIALFADLSKMDKLLLNYIKLLDDNFNFSNLTVIHYVALDSYSIELQEVIPELGEPLEEVLRKEIQQNINDAFGGPRDTIDVHIESGGSIGKLVDYIDGQKFDLVIMGKKAHYSGSGSLGGKVVRLCNANFMFIPENSRPNIQKIAVALDFSKYSEKVMEMALEVSEKTGAEIMPMTVLKAAVRYFPYIRERVAVEKSLKENHQKSYRKLQNKLGFDADLEFLVPDQDQHIGRLIYDHALSESADMVIMGNKGKADNQSLLMGSVTERLIASDKVLPVLIVK